MRDADCGVVPVTEAGRPVGVLTDRDIALALPDHEDDLAPNAGRRRHETEPIVTVDRDATLDSAMERLGGEGVRRALVVDRRRAARRHPELDRPGPARLGARASAGRLADRRESLSGGRGRADRARRARSPTGSDRKDRAMDPFSIGDPSVNVAPLFVRLTHWFNFLFLTLLVRSGLEILAAHPKLYWNDHSLPGSEWLRFTRKQMPTDRLWTSTDEEVGMPVAGSACRAATASAWAATGTSSTALGWIALRRCSTSCCCSLSPQWRRLVPTSWEIIPEAWQTFVMYLDVPPARAARAPYNYDARAAVQRAPAAHLLRRDLRPDAVPDPDRPGAVAVDRSGRFPWYDRLFGGRQAARSLHFLGLVAFLGVPADPPAHGRLATASPTEMDKMVLGERAHRLARPGRRRWGWGSSPRWSRSTSRPTRLGRSTAGPRTGRSLAWSTRSATHCCTGCVSVQDYPRSRRSRPTSAINGYPPISAYPQAKGDDDTYEQLLAGDFADYRLEVTGLVERPAEPVAGGPAGHAEAGADDAPHTASRAGPRSASGAACRSGRSSTGAGRCPGRSTWPSTRSGCTRRAAQPYYECIDIALADHPQTILAYELNGEPLPLQHGAPLRLRVETKLGFKMVKFLRSIEVVDDYRTVGDGQGGVREDQQQFDMGGQI